MKKTYLEFCSVIYHFYLGKKDNTPAMYAFWASSLMSFANLYVVYDIVRFYIHPKLPFSITLVYLLFGVICIFNYILFFKPANYKKITPKKNSGLYSVFYIVVSVLLIIWISTKHRDRYLQEKQQQKIESRNATTRFQRLDDCSTFIRL